MSTDYCEGCSPNNCGRGLCGRAALAAAPAAQAAPEFSDAAWALAQKVRADLDRQSCPGVYMDIAMESIARNLAAAPVQAVPDGLSRDLLRLADILRDCGRLVSKSAEHTLRQAAMLAAAPAAPQVPAERVPLTDGERAELEHLRALVNTPELHDFSRAVVLEAAHQRERWGSRHDAGKVPQDWFWLLGYLGGKALAAHASGNTEKALHHTISSAAALANWHAAISGTHTAMRPGIDPVERGIRAAAAKEATHANP